MLEVNNHHPTHTSHEFSLLCLVDNYSMTQYLYSIKYATNVVEGNNLNAIEGDSTPSSFKPTKKHRYGYFDRPKYRFPWQSKTKRPLRLFRGNR